MDRPLRQRLEPHDDGAGLWKSEARELYFRQTYLTLMAGEADEGKSGGAFDVTGDIRLENAGSWIWCHASPTNASPIRITAKNVTVAAGAGFDATGCGFTGVAAKNHWGAGPGGGRGSGAGGSVLLVCGSWAPTSTNALVISANGGASAAPGNRGGGGRVAILRRADYDETPLEERAYATAAGGLSSAGAGTVYWGARPSGLQVIVR